MEWVLANWGTIMTILFAAMAAAKVVVNTTNTPIDNKVYSKVYRGLEMVAGIWSAKAKQPGPAQLKSGSAP